MQTPRAVVLLCFLAFVAGCVGVSVDATQTPPQFEDNVTATVIDVVDGDTIDVRYSNGTTDTVRLLGIDAPEVRAENDPAEFEGVPDTDAGADCLRSAGDDASSALTGRIADEQITIVVDPTADRRDRYGRLLAYIEQDGTDLNHWLVAEGHARVYDTTFARSEAYYAAESEAQADRTGVWECRSVGTRTERETESDLVVESIRADATGNDHENLNDEHVVFKNAGHGSLALAGWTVRDEGGHSYVFPDDFTLAGGASVTLKSGVGTNTDETLYWGSDSAVWNNGGDTVTVAGADGQVVLQYSYPD